MKDHNVTDSALRPAGNDTITRQIHRGQRVAGSWWDTTAVCDLPGSYGPEDLLALIGVVPAIRRMGFDALLLRLAIQDVAPQRQYIASLVKAVHAADMKILVRVSPDQVTVAPYESPPLAELDADPQVLRDRTEILMDAGIDGVDLGMIDDTPAVANLDELADRFSATVSQQQAELAAADTTIILTAEASTGNPQLFNHHLQEDWFHHLRDDSLIQAPWNAREIQKRVANTYLAREPLGQAVAWRPALGPTLQGATSPRTSGPGSWADGASSQRLNAFAVYVGSLPGALYLPFAAVGGQVRVEEDGASSIRLSFSGQSQGRFQHDLTTRMLRLRNQKKMASSTLATVEGIAWAGPDVAVHLTGHTLVVLNASDDPVAVPSENIPLLYSDGFVFSDGDATILEPDTCAWFDPAPPCTHDPAGPNRWANGEN